MGSEASEVDRPAAGRKGPPQDAPRTGEGNPLLGGGGVSSDEADPPPPRGEYAGGGGSPGRVPPPKGGEASTRKGEGASASGVEAPKKGLKRKGVCPTPGVDADRAGGDSPGAGASIFAKVKRNAAR